jgi:hypothetical protein
MRLQPHIELLGRRLKPVMALCVRRRINLLGYPHPDRLHGAVRTGCRARHACVPSREHRGRRSRRAKFGCQEERHGLRLCHFIGNAMTSRDLKESSYWFGFLLRDAISFQVNGKHCRAREAEAAFTRPPDRGRAQRQARSTFTATARREAPEETPGWPPGSPGPFGPDRRQQLP